MFAAFYDRLESLKDFSFQPDHQARMKQFYVALRVRTYYSDILFFGVVSIIDRNINIITVIMM